MKTPEWVVITICLITITCLGVIAYTLSYVENFNQLLSSSHPCHFDRNYPDPTCTPGKSFANTVNKILCNNSNAGNPRQVTASMKNQVYAMYGITSHKSDGWEVDHFIPRCLGGADDITNLWPEPSPEFHLKDRVEVWLCHQVCNKTMTLDRAKAIIIVDWKQAIPMIEKDKLGNVEYSDTVNE